MAKFLMKVTVISRLYNLTKTDLHINYVFHVITRGSQGRYPLVNLFQVPVITSTVHMIGKGTRVGSYKLSSQKILISLQYAEN